MWMLANPYRLRTVASELKKNEINLGLRRKRGARVEINTTPANSNKTLIEYKRLFWISIAY
jgi:hypothetical protein